MPNRSKRRFFSSLGSILLFLLVAAGQVQAGILLVSDLATHSVLKFDANTGASLGTLVTPGSGQLYSPTAMTLGFAGDLFVTSIDAFSGNAQILRYNVSSGAFLGVFADTGAFEVLGSLAYSPTTNTLLAGSLGAGLGTSNTIYQYNAGGSTTTNITAGSVSGRTGLTFGPDGNLYASTYFDGGFGEGGVLAFDTANNFDPLGYAATPGLGGLRGASGLLFDADGNFLVAGLTGQAVVKFQMTGGVAASGAPFGDDVAYPLGMLIGPDGNLLVTSLGNNNPSDPFYSSLFPGVIFKYDISTGATIGGPNVPFITNGASFLPTAMVLLEDSNSVPEPSSWFLLVGGAVSWVAWNRRRLRRTTTR